LVLGTMHSFSAAMGTWECSFPFLAPFSWAEVWKRIPKQQSLLKSRHDSTQAPQHAKALTGRQSVAKAPPPHTRALPGRQSVARPTPPHPKAVPRRQSVAIPSSPPTRPLTSRLNVAKPPPAHTNSLTSRQSVAKPPPPFTKALPCALNSLPRIPRALLSPSGVLKIRQVGPFAWVGPPLAAGAFQFGRWSPSRLPLPFQPFRKAVRWQPPAPSLLACGDIEPNPGPHARHGLREDFQFLPTLFHRALQALGARLPDRDAFASRRNSLCPAFWTADDDAVSQPWLGESVLWMNTPFTLLRAVRAKLVVEGGNIILLCPDWAAELPTFRALSCRSVSFRGCPLFLREGRTLMPAPRWGVTVFRILCGPQALRPRAPPAVSLLQCSCSPVTSLLPCPACRTASHVLGPSSRAPANLATASRQSLLASGDVESNPGPGTSPWPYSVPIGYFTYQSRGDPDELADALLDVLCTLPPDSAGRFMYYLVYAQDNGLLGDPRGQWLSLASGSLTWSDWSGGPGHPAGRPVGTLDNPPPEPALQAAHHVAAITARDAADLQSYLDSRETYPDLIWAEPCDSTLLLEPAAWEVEPPAGGRGSLLTCGDVERNPGPFRGRGCLLSCGDVEPNPGPGDPVDEDMPAASQCSDLELPTLRLHDTPVSASSPPPWAVALSEDITVQLRAAGVEVDPEDVRFGI
jgi:hypothetical protein